MLDEVERQGFFWGDCDDATVLAGSLIVVVGVPIDLVAIRERHVEHFQHVFGEAELDDGSVAIFDPTEPPGTIDYSGMDTLRVGV
jgi:hypothetical protein